jgi:hypothetical protein
LDSLLETIILRSGFISTITTRSRIAGTIAINMGTGITRPKIANTIAMIMHLAIAIFVLLLLCTIVIGFSCIILGITATFNEVIIVVVTGKVVVTFILILSEFGLLARSASLS